MSNKWMTDEQISGEFSWKEDEMDKLKHIRDLAADHYEPLLEAKEKEVEELKARLSVYPMGAFAPGNYMGKCSTCGADFMGDKRAAQCNKCGYESSVLQYKSGNATLLAEVERLNVIKRQFEERHIQGQYIVGKDTFENIKSIADENTRLRESVRDNAIKFAEWVLLGICQWNENIPVVYSKDKDKLCTTSELYDEWEQASKKG